VILEQLNNTIYCKWQKKFNVWYFLKNLIMKKIKRLIIVFFVSISLFSSCKQKSEDIKVNELKEVSEFLEAGIIVLDEIIELKKNHPRDIALGFKEDKYYFLPLKPNGEFTSKHTDELNTLIEKYNLLEDSLSSKIASENMSNYTLDKKIDFANMIDEYENKKKIAFKSIELTPDLIK